MAIIMQIDVEIFIISILFFIFFCIKLSRVDFHHIWLEKTIKFIWLSTPSFPTFIIFGWQYSLIFIVFAFLMVSLEKYENKIWYNFTTILCTVLIVLFIFIFGDRRI